MSMSNQLLNTVLTNEMTVDLKLRDKFFDKQENANTE